MRRIALSLALGLALNAGAQECTGQWDLYFDTNPLHPKYLSGDTSAGYAVFSFWGDPNLGFEISGRFPRARFMSFETESTRLAISEDRLFDYQIAPDPGSFNPFLDGVALDVEPREYRIFAIQNKPADASNTVQLPDGRLPQAIMYRVYSPSAGVSLSSADLPRILAFDKRSGRPVSCPSRANYDPKFHFPEFLADIYTAVKPFEFKVADDMAIAGLNKASGYMYAVTPLHDSQVVVTRFRAPTFFSTQSGEGAFSTNADVRYWSFCTQDFPKNLTHNCVPDFLSTLDSYGGVTVVVGTGDEVKQAALSRGYSFLPDNRRPGQRVLGFVYRNLVPNAEFREKVMYKGEYVPSAVVCSRQKFVIDDCR